MDQIRENQIIDTPEAEQNPYFAPPRDLQLNIAQQESVVTSSGNTFLSQGSQSDANNQGNVNYGESFNDASHLPSTPAIIGIKEQIVNMHDDGTATIDIVLNVQDIKGITEYDVRVAKDAGSL